MKAIKRLYEYINYKECKPTRFEKKLGLSNGYLGTQLKRNADLGESVFNKIIDYCLDLNPEWLLTGNGEMLKEEEATEKKPVKHKHKGFPLIPVEAMAGYEGSDVQIMGFDIQEDFMITPELDNKGVKYLIRVSGSSMIPKYNNGDLLACRPITDVSFMQWGKVYVLDTDQGQLVKRLYPCTPVDHDYFECRSENFEEYPPFKILKTSIRKIAIVVGVLRME